MASTCPPAGRPRTRRPGAGPRSASFIPGAPRALGKLPAELPTFPAQDAAFRPQQPRWPLASPARWGPVLLPRVAGAASGGAGKARESPEGSSWQPAGRRAAGGLPPAGRPESFLAPLGFSRRLEFAKIFLALERYRCLCRHLECSLLPTYLISSSFCGSPRWNRSFTGKPFPVPRGCLS